MGQIRLNDFIHYTGKPPMRIQASINNITHYGEPESVVTRLCEPTELDDDSYCTTLLVPLLFPIVPDYISIHCWTSAASISLDMYSNWIVVGRSLYKASLLISMLEFYTSSVAFQQFDTVCIHVITNRSPLLEGKICGTEYCPLWCHEHIFQWILLIPRR